MHSGTIPQNVIAPDRGIDAVVSVPVREIRAAAVSRLAAPRLQGIDFARFLAAIAIVFHHAPRSTGLVKDLSMIGRFSTPLFSLLAAFFLVRHFRLRREQGVSGYVGGRIRRLVVPFFAWSVIYLAARWVNRLIFGKQSDLAWVADMTWELVRVPSAATFFAFMDAHSGWNLLWMGTSYQLWFLPFMFVVSMVAIPLILLTLGDRRREIGVACVLLALGLFMTFTFDKQFLPDGLRYSSTATLGAMFYFRSPSFLWGLALGLLCAAGRPPVLGRRGATLVGCIAAMCLSVYVLDFRHERTLSIDGAVDPSATIVFVRLAAACILFLAFANWTSPVVKRLASLGALGYGIYLSHVLVIEFLHGLRRSQGIEADWATDLLVFAIAFPASLTIAWVLGRSRFTRWLIP